MKTILLFIYLLCPPDTSKYNVHTLMARFTDAIKTENILYLQFTDAKKKYWYFNAIRSETVPYVFYTTEHNGHITINQAIRNHRFSITYNTVLSGDRKENWITGLRDLKVNN